MSNESSTSLLSYVKKIFTSGNQLPFDDPQKRVARRERILVFLIAYVLAFFMWLIVNLNSNFSISLNMPIQEGNIPPDMSLTDELPEFVQVNLSGQGLQLMNVYNNPPTVTVDLQDGEINLFDEVRRRMSSMQDVEVVKVQPLLLAINLEEQITKKVPLRFESVLEFEPRFGLIGSPALTPDSISITGPASKISSIDYWQLQDTLRFSNLKEDVNTQVPIQTDNSVLRIAEEVITFTANVSEFTEAETTVYIQTRGLPRGENVNYNPASVIIRYDVPIELFAEISRQNPYEVYVSYNEIIDDNTGFVTPDVEQIMPDIPIRLRSFQPKAVAYFSVLDQ
ncbi:MAG: CdaR family protein [Bacteroidota bacterium]